jgi:hypothetical protein
MLILLLVVKVFKIQTNEYKNSKFEELYVETRCGLYLSLLDANR